MPLFNPSSIAARRASSRFLSSGIARAMSVGNPKYIAGLSGIELALQVASRTGSPLPTKDAFIDMGSPSYWTGWTLAYLSQYLNLDFGTLQKRGVDALALCERFPVLHEADLSKAVSFAQKRLKEYSGKGSPLKQARKNARLSQKELAELSGNSLRIIRAYEQGQRSLESAGAGAVHRLCKALGCQPVDILP